MQRVSGANYLANGAGAGKNTYQDYNPATGQAGTTPNAAALTALQEEIASLIEWQGLALNPADNTQLRQAIIAYVASLTSTFETTAAATTALASAIAGVDTPAEVAAAISAALGGYLTTAAAAATYQPLLTAQSWSNVTGSRVSGTTYTNTETREIDVLVVFPDTVSGSPTITVVVGGVTLINALLYDQGTGSASAITFFSVPPETTYSVTWTSGESFTEGAVQWNEKR